MREKSFTLRTIRKGEISIVVLIKSLHKICMTLISKIKTSNLVGRRKSTLPTLVSLNTYTE